MHSIDMRLPSLTDWLTQLLTDLLAHSLTHCLTHRLRMSLYRTQNTETVTTVLFASGFLALPSLLTPPPYISDTNLTSFNILALQYEDELLTKLRQKGSFLHLTKQSLLCEFIFWIYNTYIHIWYTINCLWLCIHNETPSIHYVVPHYSG